MCGLKTQKTPDTRLPAVLVLHPIVGCVEEEARLFELLRGVRVAGVFWEESAVQAPGAPSFSSYPDLYAARYERIARHIAARYRVPLVRFPRAGVCRLLRNPARYLTPLQKIWPQSALPTDWESAPPCLFPVGFPPEEMRTASRNAARGYCGGERAQGIVIDWLAQPQRIFCAGWEQLTRPLFGKPPARVGYAEFPDMPAGAVRGSLYLSCAGRRMRVCWDNDGKVDHTNSSRLYYGRGKRRLVFKSSRILYKGGVDRRGPEYAEKLCRLSLFEKILQQAGVENALPIRLLRQAGKLAGFVMYDLSEDGRDLEILTLLEEYDGYSVREMVAILEELCRCAAFYHRMGIYFSDIKVNNFFLAHRRVIPIDTDGFSVCGSAASPCTEKYRRAGTLEYGRIPYYHTAANEAYALAVLLFFFLEGGYDIPARCEGRTTLTPALWKAFSLAKTSDPPDAAYWAELLHQYRLTLEGDASSPVKPILRLDPVSRWDALRPIRSDCLPGLHREAVDILFDHS